MKKLIRRIIRWVYGYDILLAIHFLERRQENLKDMFLDMLMREAMKDAGFKPADTIHCEEKAIWPASELDNKAEEK